MTKTKTYKTFEGAEKAFTVACLKAQVEPSTVRHFIKADCLPKGLPFFTPCITLGQPRTDVFPSQGHVVQFAIATGLQVWA
jgi:hypothetical protein